MSRKRGFGGILRTVVILLFTQVLAFPCLAQSAAVGISKNFEIGLTSLEKAPDAGRWLATLSMRVADQHLIYRHSVSLKIDPMKIDAVWPEAHEKLDPFEGKMVQVYPGGQHLFSLNITPGAGLGVATLTVEYQGCSSVTCFMPARAQFPVSFPRAADTNPVAASFPIAVSTVTPQAAPPTVATVAPSAPALAAYPASKASETGTASVRAVSTPSGQTDFGRLISERGVLWALLIAFLGGLLVSLTPCVYPMIPITLSIIGGRKENTTLMRGFSLSVTYVAGLSITYALLGLLVAAFGAQVRGILQGPGFQLVMAGIFALLALSMFDLFMIEAPAFLRKRLAGAQGSGPGGVFLLGMLSGLMASPCVAAPLAGILAFIAATGSLVLGFLMLLSFAWGMGLLLIMIGTFSGAVQGLPRAGEWMNRVKEFYGFLLAGAALYFARPVIGDPWGDLGVALVLASFSAFLGLFSPPATDDRLAPRVFKAWGVVTLTVGCVFAVSAVSHWGGVNLSFAGNGSPKDALTTETAGLAWHDRFDDALKSAKADRRPIFVDFRADWCTICREMEVRVFPDPLVKPWLARMTLLKVDCTSNEGEPGELMKRFGIIGLPTLLVLDEDGRERPEFRQVGGTEPKGLVETLRNALK